MTTDALAARSDGATASGAAVPGADPEHYERSNEFWRLVLGDSLTYSAGFWKADDDLSDPAALTAAQGRKLDWFAEAAGARPGARILDIGCGWGTVLQWVVDRFDAAAAVGVTPSDTQVAWITQLGNPRITVDKALWEDHEPSAPYDGIISINSVEEFVASALPPKEKTKAYRAFFKKCHGWLVPEGRVVLHAITMGKLPAQRGVLREMTTVVRKEFQGSHVPYLHELATGVQSLFEVTDIVNDRMDCSRTMQVWADRVREHRDQAVALEGEDRVAAFERYLEVTGRLFAQGYFNDYRIALTRLG
jgi:cyclopropane-fatty-acyl-phospholipid synthase